MIIVVTALHGRYSFIVNVKSVNNELVLLTIFTFNTNTKKFHFPSCSSVDSMKDKNKLEYTGTRDEVIAMGYEPCKRCNP